MRFGPWCVVGNGGGPGADHEPGRVPQLVREVARLLDLGLAELLVEAGRRSVDQRETEGVRTRLVDEAERVDDVDIFWPSGSRISPER